MKYRFIKSFLLFILPCIVSQSFAALSDTLVKSAELKDTLDEPKTFFDTRFKSIKIKYRDVFIPPVSTSDDDSTIVNKARYQVARAKALYEDVKKNEAFMKLTGPLLSVELPFGIKNHIGNQENIIIIDSMFITSTSGYLSACMISIHPKGDTLVFRADSIAFNPGGFTGEAYLYLVTDASIDIGENAVLNIRGGSNKVALNYQEGENSNVLSDVTLNTGGKDSKTYLKFDCNGFRKMSLVGDIVFDRSLLIPMKGDSIAPDSVKVKAEFETELEGWHDFLAEVTFTEKFRSPKLEGFDFEVRSAVFDFSGLKNSSNMTFPDGYMSKEMPEPNSPLWEGFYLKELKVNIPRKFKSDSLKRTNFIAQNILIDDMGISGKFDGYNLIDLGKGDMDGWNYSLDTMRLDMLKNQVQELTFSGDMQVPIMDEGTPLAYSGFWCDGGDYLFNVELGDTLNVPIWRADMTLYSGSMIEVAQEDDKFKPKAVLHGNLTIEAKGNTSISIADIDFQGLTIENKAPYISVQHFAISSDKQFKFANFPININKINLFDFDKGNNADNTEDGSGNNNDADGTGEQTADNNTGGKRNFFKGLNFDVDMNMMKASSGGFSAKADFAILAELEDVLDINSWSFEKIQFNKATIDVNTGSMKLKGSLEIYRKDETYGKGLKGMIDAWFQPGVGVSAVAQFGNVEGVGRYWYVDALATFANGIPVASCPVGFYGFGGGAYYKMRREDANLVELPDAFEDLAKQDTTGMAGKSLSGVKYVPDSTISLGIKATVVFGTYPSPKSFNAETTFQIEFNDKDNGGGISRIGFEGKAYFMTTLQERSPEAPVYAHILMDYVMKTKTFHSNLDVFVNLEDGKLKGTGDNNKAANAVIHFDPEDWYIHIGKPSNRAGIEILNKFRLDSYFQTGTVIDGFAELPPKVMDYLDDMDVDMTAMQREDDLDYESGFAFGASMSFQVGDEKKYLKIFFADIDVLLGFDIMLKDYGASVRCSDSNEQIGINGWYASGQAYSYLDAKVGMEVTVFKRKMKFTVLEADMGAILQTKMPNPFWMQGAIAGNYNVLNGLVKGSFDFDFEVGEQCQIESYNPVANIEVISDLSPMDAEEDVNVFTAPQAAFNLEINKSFEVNDQNGDKMAVRIVLNEFKVTSNGTQLNAALEWNEENTVVAYNTYDILPQNTELTVFAEVLFQEWKNNNWQSIIVDNEEVTETKTHTFTTGAAPNYIPLSNVKYSYPIINQFNFYKDEYDIGYIQLEKGQDYLFDMDDNVWKQKVRIQGGDKQFLVNYEADTTANNVEFLIPNDLEKNIIYEITLVNIPAAEDGEVDENLHGKIKKEEINENNTMDVVDNELEGNIDRLQEKDIYGTHFRTSMYNTFNQKIDAYQINNAGRKQIYEGTTKINLVYSLIANYYNTELFDKYELKQDLRGNKIVQMKAKLNNGTNLSDEIVPITYNDYPVHPDMIIDWRETSELGIPPISAVSMFQYPYEDDAILTVERINNNNTEMSQGFGGFCFELAYPVHKDLMTLRQISANLITNGEDDDRIVEIFNYIFPSIGAGNHNIALRYVLPGRNIVTHQEIISIVN